MKQKLKKAILFLSVQIMLLLSVVISGVSAGHIHNYAVLVKEEPNCVTQGAIVYVCSSCGDSYTQTVDALGHNYESTWRVDKEPSCFEEGVKSRHCTRCNAVTDTININKTNHAFVNTVHKPTCTEYGYTERVCKNCGSVVPTDYVKPKGHTLSIWIVDKEPTCVDSGLRHRYCTVCGETTEQVLIPPEGHVYTDTAVSPTCTENGYTLHKCRICSYSYTDKKVKAAGHSYPANGTPLTQPTCTEKGSERVTCSVCGHIETRTVAALGHNYSENWTIDKQPTCAAAGQKSYHCTRCSTRKNITSIEKLEHIIITDKAVAATCTEKGLTKGSHCSTCGKVIEKQTSVAALGHSYKTTEVISLPTCTQTGSEKAICTRCNRSDTVSTAALGHNYSEKWTIDKAATCSAAGEKSHHCSRCNSRKNVTSIEKFEHTVVTDKAVAATCTEKGLTKGSHCSTCGKVIEKQKTVPAKGHETVKTVNKATLNGNGKISEACSVCGEVISSKKIYKINSVSLSSSSFSYDSKVKKPTAKITDSNGKTLRNNEDYKIAYSAGRKNVGTYTAKITFIGNYSGTKTLKFKIIPKKPTGVSASQTANSITLSWNKVPGATGYRVYEYISKAKGYKTVAVTKNLYCRISRLKSGEKHTYCVKAYKKVNGQNIFSDYSSQKKTATKPADFTLKVSRSGQRAVLSWKKAGNCEYEIYQSDKKNGKYVCIGTTKKGTFTTGYFSRGTSRCFKVKACVKSSTTTLCSTSSDIKTVRF